MTKHKNGTSRQRIVRVPIPLDDWLLEKVKEERLKDPSAGVATIINSFIRQQYEKAHPRRSA